MAGLLDYIANSMSGGQMSPEELQASIYAKRAASSVGGLNATRGEATPADLMRVMATMKNASPKGSGMMTEKEGATLNNAITMPPTSGMGNMTEVEAARIKQLMMQKQMDEFSRQNAYMSNPQAAQYYQNTNPLGNTMQNITPQAGGMAVRNTQPPMDLNMLLRLLGR